MHDNQDRWWLSAVGVVAMGLVSSGCEPAAPSGASGGFDTVKGSTRPSATEAGEPDAGLMRDDPIEDTDLAGGALPSSTAATEEGPRRLSESAGDPVEGLRDPSILFDNWPRPDLVFFLTGQQRGYIEPCGCTGLENQKGGLARRHTLARELEERGWPIVALDAGNQVRRVGRQAEIKFQVTVEGLRTIGYDAVALGGSDLRLSVGELMAATAAVEGQNSLFVSANAAILDRSLTPSYQIVERAGKKIGVTSVIGQQWLDDVMAGEIVKSSPGEALSTAVRQLEAADCDLYVLLAHATIEESKAFARTFPQFDLVVTAGGEGDPTYQPERIGSDGPLLVQVGIKGMYVGVVGVFGNQQPTMRYQRVALESRFEDSRQMLRLLASYQQQLQALGLQRLGVKPLPHPSGRSFVGSQKCGECHTMAFETWEGTPHAHATDSLVYPNERSEIPRHFDPECLSCHVTGWNAQRYFPYASGYLGLEQSQLMHGSGCENCHGPGSEHVAAEEEDLSEAIKLQRREEMRLPLDKAERNCLNCHDLDNSPDFHEPGAFQEYWERVEHYGVD